jgi:hypothetical protein
LVGRPQVCVERRFEADLGTGCGVLGNGGRNRIFANVQADVVSDRRIIPDRLVTCERAPLELLASGRHTGAALVVAVISAEALQLQAEAAVLERTSADGDGAGRVGELGLVGGQRGRRIDCDDPLVHGDHAGRPGIPLIRQGGAAADKAQQGRGSGGEAAFGRCGAGSVRQQAHER